jgi:16S rRNA (uracil1498-N3)-methyltransferase
MAHILRLYTHEALKPGMHITLDAAQSHYVVHVMRASEGTRLLVFNGRDGQWQATIASLHKKATTLHIEQQTRPQAPSPDIWYAFSPLKNKTELVVEKATEMGVSRLIPVVMRHSVVRSINLDKLQIEAIEAAQQCERLDIPTLETQPDLSYLLGNWPKGRLLLYGDETGGGTSLHTLIPTLGDAPLGVLIGPEGGFAKEEIDMLQRCDFTRPFGLGPRILRADTAAVASLACVFAQRGDWNLTPHFKAAS